MYQIYFIFGMTLYVFWAVFPSIIRSSRLHTATGICQTVSVYVKQILLYLFDKCLLLYVQS